MGNVIDVMKHRTGRQIDMYSTLHSTCLYVYICIVDLWYKFYIMFGIQPSCYSIDSLTML